MTRAELRALFRLMAGPEFDELASEVIDDWINDAHRYICAAFRVYERPAQLTFNPNSSWIELPDRFVALHDGYGNSGALIDEDTNQGLIEITPAEARLKTLTGHTTHVWFWIWGTHIHILPIIKTGKIYQLQHFSLDAELSDDEHTPNYPEVYHELLLTYVLFKAYMSKVQEGTRDKRALTHWNLFKEQVSIVKMNQRRLEQK